MPGQILLASNNGKKLAELQRIVAEQGLDVEVLALRDFPAAPEPPETEWTFEGNALIKARAGAEHSGLPTLADDSGLCVDALNQMPGTRSARWAGPQRDDVENLELVLRQIDDVPEAQRGARFVAAVALALPDGREFTTRGEMPGRLANAPRGANGFGYDPIFIPDEQAAGEALTSAELASAAKDAISHRGQALRAMAPILRDALASKSEETK